ncbi:TPA: hypothetical protein SLO54_002864 [Citrobacter freundii]|nr:hypothetical protein [Citrobacter freundii]
MEVGMKLRNETDKYTFKMNNTGAVSLIHPTGYKIPDDEPILIFRAKDLGVLAAISGYLEMLCEQEASGTIRDHLISMLSVSMNILRYQKNKSVKSVTCSIEAHKTTIDMLKKDIYNSVGFAIDTLISTYGVSEKEINKIINNYGYIGEVQ